MIVIRVGKVYLGSPENGALMMEGCIENARMFLGVDEFYADTYEWEREELFKLGAVVVETLLKDCGDR